MQGPVSSPLYTWSSLRGDLHLYSANNNFSLKFETKDHRVLDIPLENVEGDEEEFNFEKLTSKVSEVCQNYFFRAIKQGDTYKIKFHELVVKEDFEKKEENGQQRKVGTIGFKFNKLEKKQEIQFSKDAPDYRRAGGGLNLEGKCQNAACVAFKKYVIIIKGYGLWRLGEELNKNLCPACEVRIPYQKTLDDGTKINCITNAGFTNCRWKYEGAKADSENTDDENKVWEDASAKHYTTFEGGDECDWTFLNITTERLNAGKKSGSSSNPGYKPSGNSDGSSNSSPNNSAGGCVLV